jgi:uncharacterized protein (TIGR02117 family)
MAWRKPARLFALALAAPIALFLLAALAGSHIPVNSGWRPAPGGVTIYVTTNGYHTALVLPAAAAGHDWSVVARPTDLPDPEDAGQWLLFGWGDRRFFLETPTWAKLRPGTALAAIAGSGATLVHVDHLSGPGELADARPVRLTERQYRRLVAFVRGSFAPFHGPYPPAIPGYGGRDVFYPGAGRYNLFNTCNTWTANALAAAGVTVARWTPFSGGVTRWFPAAS